MADTEHNNNEDLNDDDLIEEVIDDGHSDKSFVSTQSQSKQQEPNNTIDSVPTRIEYVYSLNMQDESISDVLNGMQLSELCELFNEKQIDVDCLQHITVSDIDNLIPHKMLGLRIKFKARLAQWRSLKRVPLSSLSECLAVVSNSSVSISSDIPEMLLKPTIVLQSDSEYGLNQERQYVNVQQILNSNSRGKKMLSKNAPLNSSERKDLISFIVDFALFNEILLGTREIKCIAEQVIKLFPFEAKDSYYVPSGNGGRARGQLYTSYNNKIKGFRKKGNFSSRPNRRCTKSENSSSSSSPSSLVDNTQSLTDKDWLKYNSQPLELVATKWKNCFGVRREDILEKPAAEIFNEWPLFTQSFGLHLIDLDFISLFGEEKSLSLKKSWPGFQKTFFQSILEQVGSASKAVKLLLAELSAADNQDYKDLITFKLLHHKLPPSQKISLQSGKKWHVSIQDSINSCIIEAENQADILLKYRKAADSHKELHINIQPMVVASENLYYFISDNIFHKVDSFISALDSAFKLIYVFNLKYPLQSQNVWCFIENFFFDLDSSIRSSSTTALINELKAKPK